MARVSIAAKGVTIRGLFDALGNGPAQSLQTDHEIAEERLTVFAQDLSHEGIIAGITALFGFELSQIVVGETQTLRQSVEQRLYERKLLNDTLTLVGEPLWKVVRESRRPSEYWRQAALKNPSALTENISRNIYQLKHPSYHARLELFDTLTLQSRRVLLEQGYISLPWEAMTERQKFLLKENSRLKQRVNSHEVPLSNVEAQAEEQSEMVDRQRNGVLIFVTEEPRTGDIYSCILDTAGIWLEPKQDSFVLSVRGKPYGTASSLAIKVGESDPALTKFPASFRWDKNDTWREILRKLSAATAQPVFSDDIPGGSSFTYFRAKYSITKKAVPQFDGVSLAKGLDVLCDYYDRLWWQEQGALFFRSRNYFLQKRYAIPFSLLKQMSAQAALSLERISVELPTVVAKLTGYQILGARVMGLDAIPSLSEQIHLDQSNGSYGLVGNMNFYRNLPANVQKRLVRGDTLQFSELEDETQYVFQKAFGLRDVGIEPTRPKESTLNFEGHVNEHKTSEETYYSVHLKFVVGSREKQIDLFYIPLHPEGKILVTLQSA